MAIGIWQVILLVSVAAFLVWLFRQRGSSASDRAAPNIEKVVHEYGAVLEQTSLTVRSTKELPYSKTVIGDALIAAIRQTPEGSVREQLKNGFVMLSGFQELTSDQLAQANQFDGAIMNSAGVSDEALVDSVRVIAESADAAIEMQKTVSQEAGDRVRRLASEGLN